ncbi:MAG: hypothetical protein LBV44_08520 [Methylobacillus sp.]|jgi:hypothetical protein|nr:hypothetical protein [Methylobacillus sp.]
MKRVLALATLLLPAASAWSLEPVAPVDFVANGAWETGRYPNVANSCFMEGETDNEKAVRLAAASKGSFGLTVQRSGGYRTEPVTLAVDAEQPIHATAIADFSITATDGLDGDEPSVLLAAMKNGKTLTVTSSSFAPIVVTLEGIEPVLQAFRACLGWPENY